MTAKLVLAGHSHVHALGVPGRSRKDTPGLVPIAHAHADIVAVVGARDEPYWDAFVDAAATRVPAVIWTGNQHYAHFLFRPTPPLDVILSSAPSLPIDRSAKIVPEAMLRAFFAPSFAGLEQMLRRLAEPCPYRAIVIGTPPPKGDPERLCRNVEKESALRNAARDLGVAVVPASLSDVGVMRKLWRLLQTMMAETAAAAGAAFVPVPPRLIAAGDVLSDGHWAADATHANRVYGAEMLAEVVRQAEANAAATTGALR